MSIPRDHHYLPQFYLDRWARDGRVFRYVRPRGAAGNIDAKWKYPKAVAYQRDLYHLPDVADPAESQQLEMRFFQRVDDRAAVAIAAIENDGHGDAEDRIALSQFMVSLLHRTPSRLAAMRTEIAKKTQDTLYADLDDDQFDKAVKAMANRLLVALVENADAASIVSKFQTFRIDVAGTRRTLLTSDRPITLSSRLVSPDAFMILPYAPHRLLILARDPEIARAFATQDSSTLVSGINQAVVEQSREIVIATDEHAKAMVDRLFLRPQVGREFDTMGLIRRKSPYRDLRPRNPLISRHNKAAMRFFGS